MEFLDPKKHKAHLIRLAIGYVLVGTALLLMTVILLYQARGFGIRNGEVIQNGLIFVSSRPVAADIFVNGQQREERTNARLLMPAGQYTFELKREGYRPWKRAINVEGGTVVRFDYPVLFPTKLTTTQVKRYDVQPPLATQSPDRRWLLIQDPAAYTTFEAHDLNNPEAATQTIAIPESIFTQRTGLHRWKLVEWSNNNRHVLLQHSAERDGAIVSEYILVDRQTPAESVNLTRTLGTGDVQIELRDKKHDLYYIWSPQDRTLKTASLEEPALKPFMQNVLGFKTHGDDRVLYATDQAAAEGKAAIRLREGDKTYTIRQVALSETYLLNLASYEDAWYIAAGAPSEGRTYVYKDPAATLRSKPRAPLVPVQVLKVPDAQYATFSDNARFIVAQNGSQFAVYDTENDRGYNYLSGVPLDAPQTHAPWMDGHRLMMVSNGKVVVFDFDKANIETLAAASPAFLPFFDRDFQFLYTLSSIKNPDGTETAQYQLGSTSLLTPADQ